MYQTCNIREIKLTSLLGSPAGVSLTVCCAAELDSDGAERSTG